MEHPLQIQLYDCRDVLNQGHDKPHDGNMMENLKNGSNGGSQAVKWLAVSDLKDLNPRGSKSTGTEN